MTDIKTDNTETLVNALEEIEKLRGRVSKLEAGYTMLCNSARLTRKILQDSAKRKGVTNITAHANWGHLDTAEHEDTIIRSDSRPWLLRKQAEAVERCLLHVRESARKGMKSDRAAVLSHLEQTVINLRNQAYELEAGGGDASGI